MKRVVSISLGSSRRDQGFELEAGGSRITVQRVGTEGDLKYMAKILGMLDGKVDALGLGGINLSLRAGRRCYLLRDGARLAAQVKTTPLVDGSGIKDTVERDLVPCLQKKLGWPRRDQVVLLVSALDRFGLAEALELAGCRLIIGDALFALGLPVPFYSLKAFRVAARATLPLLCRLPIGFLYPLGKKQEQVRPRFESFYRQAQIIAGDFHFIRYHLPVDLTGKDIITSTLTPGDVEELKARGVRWVVTPGPSISGRSFGSNVLEAICVALLDSPGVVNAGLYPDLLRQIGWGPRIEKLN